jgi:hypothetical protein
MMWLARTQRIRRVAGDRSPVLGGGVDQLPGPQVHAIQVDSGRRTVAELEVEGGLLDREGRLTGPGRVAGGDCPDQGVQAGSSGRPAARRRRFPARFQAGAMASTHEAAAAHRRAPTASKLARAPASRRSARAAGPAEGVGGDGRGECLEVAAEGRNRLRHPATGRVSGDPGLDQAKA